MIEKKEEKENNSKEKMLKEQYEVNPIDNKIASEWIILKHYSHSVPNVIFSFGLFSKKSLVGVVTFGVSNTPHNDMIGGNTYVGKVLELNRVVILDNAPLNCASFMISKTLNWLKKYSDYKIIISYADTKHQHTGYIYQATNFFYCGISKGGKRKTIKGMHPRTQLKNQNEMEHEIVETSDKHRYVYFLGTEDDKKQFLTLLKYRIMKYPKDDKKPERYFSPELKERQNKLF